MTPKRHIGITLAPRIHLDPIGLAALRYLPFQEGYKYSSYLGSTRQDL